MCAPEHAMTEGMPHPNGHKMMGSICTGQARRCITMKAKLIAVHRRSTEPHAAVRVPPADCCVVHLLRPWRAVLDIIGLDDRSLTTAVRLSEAACVDITRTGPHTVSSSSGRVQETLGHSAPHTSSSQLHGLMLLLLLAEGVGDVAQRHGHLHGALRAPAEPMCETWWTASGSHHHCIGRWLRDCRLWRHRRRHSTPHFP